MSSHPRRIARATLRAHILAVLGVAAGCSQVPTPGELSKNGLYDAIDKDGDGATVLTDCNDGDPRVKPDAEEQCNHIDDDCDGEIDEGVRAVFHRDADGDTFGSPTDTVEACAVPDGFVENDDDCNDRSAAALPGGTEVCDGLDNDCDGSTDDIPGYWPDADGDGFGSSGEPRSACEPMPDGYADNQGDCDDGDPDVHPDAVEVCHDRTDNDCDGELSCLVVSVAMEDTGADCEITWSMTDAETLDWEAPCEACDFRFQAFMSVASITGDADHCDSAVDIWSTFDVQGDDISGGTTLFVPEGWASAGGWDEGILSWYTSAYRRSLDAGGYASFSYSGELRVDEVSEYYYGYYYYEGRPLSVDGVHRVASEVARSDWRTEREGSHRAELTPAERQRAVEAWTRAGLAEHASVASFNRFVMELMSLGAPPDLLSESLGAAADEIAHARDCFGVASALAGAPVGPGPLDVDGILADMSAEGVLTRLLTEGCVEETVSTALAALRLSHATEPAVQATLQRIVADETRHAGLAWRSARWILQGRPDLVPLARTVLAEAMARPCPTDGAAVSPALRSVGVVSRADRARERQRTLDEVVAPAVAALFASVDGTRAPLRAEPVATA